MVQMKAKKTCREHATGLKRNVDFQKYYLLTFPGMKFCTLDPIVVKIYNTTSGRVRFENKIFSSTLKTP
jgi:hypothetical protein